MFIKENLEGGENSGTKRTFVENFHGDILDSAGRSSHQTRIWEKHTKYWSDFVDLQENLGLFSAEAIYRCSTTQVFKISQNS